MAAGRYVHRFDIDDNHAVHIYRGSLVEVEADALVSSDDNYLSAGGGVSAALARLAGNSVYRERLRLAKQGLKIGDVVRTSGGGLPCRNLYHAITIEDFRWRMDESVLRLLVINLLARATEDGVRVLGMPALGTGVAGFDLARASKVIVEELLDRLVDTTVHHIVLALIGDEASCLFYEQLVRGNAPRCSASSLRRFEQHHVDENQKSDSLGQNESHLQSRLPVACPSVDFHQSEPKAAGRSKQTGEQFPSLIDKTRLAATPTERPKLVAGLAAIVLKHADATEVEQELLSRPECSGFRGTIEQRLMEFLYLSESNLRTALGPSLFRAKDLRSIAEELGTDCELVRDPEQLIDLVLRALCFNLLVPPVGLTQCVARIERLILDLEAPDAVVANRIAAGIEAAKVLEQVLKDILRLYGFFFFGPCFEEELVRNKVVPARRDGIARLTLGQARDGLIRLESLITKDATLGKLLSRLGREKLALVPIWITPEHSGTAIDCGQMLAAFIRWRNQEIVHDDPSVSSTPDQRAVREQLEYLRTFLLACRAEAIYPEVLRYEGTYENRDGERFVYFLDERHAERRVRTDEHIDPRRHYYCFANNNPLHLFPVLIPKL